MPTQKQFNNDFINQIKLGALDVIDNFVKYESNICSEKEEVIRGIEYYSS
jgi:hypothetical protein